MPFASLTLSADVRALTDRFLETAVGATITFDDMTAALGASIHARRYLIQRALQVSSRESGAIFAALRGIGYRRLSAEDASLVGSHARSRIRSTTRRAVGVINRAVSVANDITEKARLDAYREVSVLRLVSHLSSDRATKAVQPTDKPQPVAITLRAMMEQIGGVASPPGNAA